MPCRAGGRRRGAQARRKRRSTRPSQRCGQRDASQSLTATLQGPNLCSPTQTHHPASLSRTPLGPPLPPPLPPPRPSSGGRTAGRRPTPSSRPPPCGPAVSRGGAASARPAMRPRLRGTGENRAGGGAEQGSGAGKQHEVRDCCLAGMLCHAASAGRAAALTGVEQLVAIRFQVDRVALLAEQHLGGARLASCSSAAEEARYGTERSAVERRARAVGSAHRPG